MGLTRSPLRLRRSAVFVLWMLGSGCGGSSQAAVVTSPFTAEHAEVFEDGLDFVHDPDVLEGRWRDDWSSELQKRVGWADLIGVVHVRTLRTDTTPDREVTYRLIVSVERSILGSAPDEELSLVVRQGEGGFESVRTNERRILDQSFVAFIKWYQDEREEIVPHWHLAPATDPVVRRTEYLVRTRRSAEEDDERRVIVVED